MQTTPALGLSSKGGAFIRAVPSSAWNLAVLQVYEALQAEGYRVHYVRVPLTHGVAPRARDFDAFYASAAAAGPNDALIFTCQLVRLHPFRADWPHAAQHSRRLMVQRASQLHALMARCCEQERHCNVVLGLPTLVAALLHNPACTIRLSQTCGAPLSLAFAVGESIPHTPRS